MDIGSAKVDDKSRSDIPHHLINVTRINDHFSAGDYFKLARSSIEVIKVHYRDCTQGRS